MNFIHQLPLVDFLFSFAFIAITFIQNLQT